MHVGNKLFKGNRLAIIAAIGLVIITTSKITANSNLCEITDLNEKITNINQPAGELEWGKHRIGFESPLVPGQRTYLMWGMEIYSTHYYLGTLIHYDAYFEISSNTNGIKAIDTAFDQIIGDGSGDWSSTTLYQFNLQGTYQINYTIYDITNNVTSTVLQSFEVTSEHSYRPPSFLAVYGIENESSYTGMINVKASILTEQDISYGYGIILNTEQKTNMSFKKLEFGPESPDDDKFVGIHKYNCDVAIDTSSVLDGEHIIKLIIVNIDEVSTSILFHIDTKNPQSSTSTNMTTSDNSTSITSINLTPDTNVLFSTIMLLVIAMYFKKRKKTSLNKKAEF